jgi:hypothetical protein
VIIVLEEGRVVGGIQGKEERRNDSQKRKKRKGKTLKKKKHVFVRSIILTNFSSPSERIAFFEW